MTDCPVLALPGLVNDEQLWQHPVAALGSRHPFTSFALVPHRSMGELAEMALARAPAGRFALMGLSMGGYLAFEVLRRAPERVLALALLDTSARPDTPEQTATRRQAIAASTDDYEGVVRGLLPKLVHADHVEDPAVTEPLMAMARRVGRDGYVGQQEAIIGRADSRPTLAQVRMPTLVLCGRDDQLTPLALHEEMHAGIAGSQLVVVDRCGHMSPLEQPEAVTAAIAEWLGRAAA